LTMPTTRLVALSKTGAPEKPGVIWGLLSCRTLLPCIRVSPRMSPFPLIPSSGLTEGKPNVWKEWPLAPWDEPRERGRTPWGSGSFSLRNATSSASAGRNHSGTTEARALPPPARKTSTTSAPAWPSLGWAAAARTWAQVTARFSATTKPVPAVSLSGRRILTMPDIRSAFIYPQSPFRSQAGEQE